jgi:hypothetical protein
MRVRVCLRTYMEGAGKVRSFSSWGDVGPGLPGAVVASETGSAVVSLPS